MMRSEMIKELTETVSYIRAADISDFSAAEHILRKMELLGMLPPYQQPLGCGDFDYEECCDAHLDDCKWSEE